MEKYINEFKKECYRGVDVTTPLSPDLFHKPKAQTEGDESFAFHSELGSLTVLDRMTGYGYGIRDIESGFRDMEGNFWLASGGCDVRYSGCKTVGEATQWVKRRVTYFCSGAVGRSQGAP